MTTQLVTETTSSADGTTIEFDRTGRGPAVVLVGGGPTDRTANSPIAELLADSCTVYNYDRRGRGGSGDGGAIEVERECDDLAAVIAAAGGTAGVFGTSSGAALIIHAVARGVAPTSLALWEPPYVVDDSRRPPPDDLANDYAELIAAGRTSDALRLFFTGAVALTDDVVGFMETAPFWPAMEALAPAVRYDIAVMGDFSLPADELASVATPCLVLDGGTTPWLTASADAVGATVARAVRQTIAGQPHNVDPSAIAPVLKDWFTTAA